MIYIINPIHPPINQLNTMNAADSISSRIIGSFTGMPICLLKYNSLIIHLKARAIIIKNMAKGIFLSNMTEIQHKTADRPRVIRLIAIIAFSFLNVF